MTVCTANFTFEQLTCEPEWAAAATHQPRNMIGLVVQVIELENQRIAFAAVDAYGRGKKLPHNVVVARISRNAKSLWTPAEVGIDETSVVDGSGHGSQSLMAIGA